MKNFNVSNSEIIRHVSRHFDLLNSPHLIFFYVKKRDQWSRIMNFILKLANFFLGLFGIYLDLSSGCRVTFVTILHLPFVAVIGERFLSLRLLGKKSNFVFKFRQIFCDHLIFFSRLQSEVVLKYHFTVWCEFE